MGGTDKYNVSIDCGDVMSDARQGHPMFYKLLKKAADLHDRKNTNYAAATDPLSNLKASGRMGIEPWKGALVRMQDKMSRLEQLAQGTPDLVGESIEDSLMDLGIYAFLAIVLLREGG